VRNIYRQNFAKKKSEAAWNIQRSFFSLGEGWRGEGEKTKILNGGHGYFQDLHTTSSVFMLCMETRVSLELAVYSSSQEVGLN